MEALHSTLLLFMVGGNEVNVLHIGTKSHAASDKLINGHRGFVLVITSSQHLKEALEMPRLEVNPLEGTPDPRVVEVLLQLSPADTCPIHVNIMQESLEVGKFAAGSLIFRVSRNLQVVFGCLACCVAADASEYVENRVLHHTDVHEEHEA